MDKLKNKPSNYQYPNDEYVPRFKFYKIENDPNPIVPPPTKPRFTTFKIEAETDPTKLPPPPSKPKFPVYKIEPETDPSKIPPPPSKPKFPVYKIEPETDPSKIAPPPSKPKFPVYKIEVDPDANNKPQPESPKAKPKFHTYQIKPDDEPKKPVPEPEKENEPPKEKKPVKKVKTPEPEPVKKIKKVEKVKENTGNPSPLPEPYFPRQEYQELLTAPKKIKEGPIVKRESSPLPKEPVNNIYPKQPDKPVEQPLPAIVQPKQKVTSRVIPRERTPERLILPPLSNSVPNSPAPQSSSSQLSTTRGSSIGSRTLIIRRLDPFTKKSVDKIITVTD